MNCCSAARRYVYYICNVFLIVFTSKGNNHIIISASLLTCSGFQLKMMRWLFFLCYPTYEFIANYRLIYHHSTRCIHLRVLFKAISAGREKKMQHRARNGNPNPVPLRWSAASQKACQCCDFFSVTVCHRFCWHYFPRFLQLMLRMFFF